VIDLITPRIVVVVFIEINRPPFGTQTVFDPALAVVTLENFEPSIGLRKRTGKEPTPLGGGATPVVRVAFRVVFFPLALDFQGSLGIISVPLVRLFFSALRVLSVPPVSRLLGAFGVLGVPPASIISGLFPVVGPPFARLFLDSVLVFQVPLTVIRGPTRSTRATQAVFAS
jgi:hypothetical protein